MKLKINSCRKTSRRLNKKITKKNWKQLKKHKKLKNQKLWIMTSMTSIKFLWAKQKLTKTIRSNSKAKLLLQIFLQHRLKDKLIKFKKSHYNHRVTLQY